LSLKKLSSFLLVLTMFVLLVTGCARSAPAQPPVQPPAENGPAPDVAATLVEGRCARCHALDLVYRERDAQLWPGIVTRMVSLSPGLLTDDEYSLVVEYLQENYGK
jgi:hypothetical protein